MPIDYNNCYPGIVDSDQTCVRYVDKESNMNEEYLFSNYYREQINQYGTNITYYVNAYNVLSADNFYGEDPTRKYSEGRDIIAFVDLAENANTLSKFGFQADDEITIHIHLSAFYTTFYDIGTEYIAAEQGTDSNILAQNDDRMRTENPNIYETQFKQVQPKSGDVFALTEYGKGRVGGRGPKQFEVTEVLDEDISKYNPLGGHYTWIIKGKRFEYSFEPGMKSPMLQDEKKDDQVFDNSFSGVLSGGKSPVSPAKKYDEQYPLKSIDEVSAKDVFDMPKNNNTDVYGSY
jgi:hypothetical protein